MVYQARDQRVKNYRNVKKHHDFPMKEFLESPEKKASSCSSEFRVSAPDGASLQYDKVLEGKALILLI